MRRRHRDQPPKSTTSTTHSEAIPITTQELISLVGVLEHAHTRIAELSHADVETIIHASGTALIPLLYARAGLALTHGRGNIPLLSNEVGLLESAVINLETYQGNEVVLVAGYQLLADFSHRQASSCPVRQIHGILSFADGTGDTTSGSVTPSLT